MHNDTVDLHGSSQIDDMRARNDTDLRMYRKLKAENRELGLMQEEAIGDHNRLSEKVSRMSDNLKKMKYADAMESKLNITNNRLNRYHSIIQ
jgi:hypothetical protein